MQSFRILIYLDLNRRGAREGQKPLHLSNEPKSFGYRYSFCRAPWSMTEFARKQYRNAVIGAIYPYAGMWLVRDTYPYAAIWMVRNTYPNAVIWLVRAAYNSTRYIYKCTKNEFKKERGKAGNKIWKILVAPSLSLCIATISNSEGDEVVLYLTRIYPMTFMFLSPLSPSCFALFPQIFSRLIPKPILELQDPQCFSLLLRMPILARCLPHVVLKPSMLQVNCKEPSEPIRDFHRSRPRVVWRCCPSAISENREFACFSMTIKFVTFPILIPRQILEKGVSQ